MAEDMANDMAVDEAEISEENSVKDMPEDADEDELDDTVEYEERKTAGIDSTTSLPATLESIEDPFHDKEYVSVTLLLMQLMLSACVVVCGMFWIGGANANPLYVAANLLDIDENKEIRDNGKAMGQTLAVYFAIPMGAGIILILLDMFLIYQTFFHGISMYPQLVGNAVAVLFSAFLVVGAVYTAMDLSKFPHDTVGIVNKQSNAYIRVMQMLLSDYSEGNKTRNRIRAIALANIRLQCCGFYSVSDFYNMDVIQYYDTGGTPSTWRPFRVTNGWAHDCRAEHGRTADEVCVAPIFCCRTHDTELLINKTMCNVVKNKANGGINPFEADIYQTPCLWAIVSYMRDQMICLALYAGGILLITCILTFWLLFVSLKHSKSKEKCTSDDLLKMNK